MVPFSYIVIYEIKYSKLYSAHEMQQISVQNISKLTKTVKGITSTSYFSAHLKNTTLGVLERKSLCSGDVLDLADLTDKAK